jgi:DNA-binding protein HU-beta
MAKMTKSQLLEKLANAAGLTKKDVTKVLDALVNTAYSEVKSSGEFSLTGLGKLIKKHRAARQGRNPATGATIQIPAKTVVKFRVSKAAKDAIL